IGAEYQQSNKPVEALKYFCKYLDADTTGANTDYVTAQVKTLQIQLGNQVDDKNVCKPIAPPPAPVHEAPAKPATVTGTEALDHDDKPDATERPRHGKGLEYTGLVVAGAGAIATALGIYYGMQAKDKSDYITQYATNPATAGMP